MDLYDADLDWEEESYEALREALSPRYRDLSPGEIAILLESAGLSADEMEFNLGQALGSVGRSLQTAAPAVLPVAGTVVGTAVGGPLGGMLGGTLGQLAGGAIRGAGRPEPARPTAAGPAAPQPAVPQPMPRTPTGGSPAAAQLLQLLNRPELLQSLLSMVLGQAGQRQTTVGSTPVPAAAFANLIGQLANQAAAEYNTAMDWVGEAVPVYLLDSNGNFLVDPAVPEQRAARLLGLLNEAIRQEAFDRDEDEAWLEDDPAEEYNELDAYYDSLEIIEADDW